MIDIFFKNIDVINFLAILALIVFFVAFLFLYLRRFIQKNLSLKFTEFYSKIKNDINFAVAPNLINLAPNTDDFIQFAIEIWRIEQRVFKLAEILSENQRKGLENSIFKFKRYLEKYDIEIIDYTNQKFNDGLNLDVLSVEKDPSIFESIVKETVEPTIMYRGQVVKKAKIIVLSKLN